MATVTDWIQHLTTDVDSATDGVQVAGITPGAGSTETLLVIACIVFWIGWHVITARSESEKLARLARKRHGANDHKSNITDW